MDALTLLSLTNFPYERLRSAPAAFLWQSSSSSPNSFTNNGMISNSLKKNETKMTNYNLCVDIEMCKIKKSFGSEYLAWIHLRLEFLEISRRVIREIKDTQK